MEFCRDLFDLVSLPRSAVEALLEKNEASIKVYLYGLVRGEAEVAQISACLSLIHI